MKDIVIVHRCKICNRPLKSKQSIELGMGAVCFKTLTPKEQLLLEAKILKIFRQVKKDIGMKKEYKNKTEEIKDINLKSILNEEYTRFEENITEYLAEEKGENFAQDLSDIFEQCPNLIIQAISTTNSVKDLMDEFELLGIESTIMNKKVIALLIQKIDINSVEIYEFLKGL